MTFNCTIKDLANESDVEQKLIYPLLTSAYPDGLGFSPAEIYTKANIHFLRIDKGAAAKLYRPDYVVLIGGLPVLLIEAKSPGESLSEALRECRLYASEFNAQYTSGINPCIYVAAINGHEVAASHADTETIEVLVPFDQLHSASSLFHDLLAMLGRKNLESIAKQINEKRNPSDYHRPLALLGGHSVRNEEVGYNDFGAKLALDFMHIFNPRTRAERAHVVKNAYVPSLRRNHYVDEIERIVRNAVPRPSDGSTLIDDTSQPSALLHALGRGKELQNRLFLLVGPVGSGKSTFVDYFRETQLTSKMKESTTWLTIDVNEAPVGREMMESWLLEEVIRLLKSSHTTEDLDVFDNLKKVFSVEINLLVKGPLAALPKNSEKRSEMISEHLLRLSEDRVKYARALARYLCSQRSKLLVLVLDNCDKGDLEEQLTVFQIVRWIQGWLPCLVFLPLRDVTYETHQMRPPLDTVIKDFVFRIEPPSFAVVLRKRILLALSELQVGHRGKLLEYKLESGAAVVYPSTELGLYLASLHKLLYEHDRLLRRCL